MIKGVVFDMDHTLFDRYATLRRISPDFYRHFAQNVSDKYTPETFAKLFCEADRRYVYYGWEKVFEALVAAGVFVTAPDFEDYKEFLLSEFRQVAVPFSFTNPMLKKLRADGYKLGLITNGKGDTQFRKIEMLGFEPLFDAIIVCGEFGKSKPAPEPFYEMAKRLGCAPRELVYIGDHPVFDVVASERAGYVPVWVTTTGTWPKELSPTRYRIATVAETEKVLEQIKKDGR